MEKITMEMGSFGSDIKIDAARIEIRAKDRIWEKNIRTSHLVNLSSTFTNYAENKIQVFSKSACQNLNF